VARVPPSHHNLFLFLLLTGIIMSFVIFNSPRGVGGNQRETARCGASCKRRAPAQFHR